ncbi:MAG: prolipoprotein diacylglyceryl transferase family protein [Actinomycetota bacterium]
MLRFLAEIGWPVLDRFRFGDSFAISPHGVFIAIGFMTGAWLLGRIAPRWGVSQDDVQGVVFWSLIGSILGARVFYVIGHFSDFDSFVDMLQIWEGGISLLGGIAGGVIVNVPRVLRAGYRFFQVADPVAPSLALGIAVGRLGDLIIADHLGKPTSWLLAWQYRGGAIAPPFVESAPGQFVADLQDGVTQLIDGRSAVLKQGAVVLAEGVGVHQTALYDMFSALVLFGLLYVVMMRRPRREGILTLTFGLWYGLSRILEDSLRIDKRFFGLTGSQWTALTVATICAALLVWFAARSNPDAPSGGGAEPDVADRDVETLDSEPADNEPETAT